MMAAAGGRYAFIGFESISDDAFAFIRKRINRTSRFREDVCQLNCPGIIMGSFIFGLGRALGRFTHLPAQSLPVLPPAPEF